MEKFHPLSKTFDHEASEGIIFSQLSNIFWILLVYIGALILQNIQQPTFISSLIFSLILAVHTVLYFYPSSSNRDRGWYYFFVQVCLLFISAFILPKGSPIVLIGLLPVLIAQSIIILKNKVKAILFFIFSYGLYCIAMAINYGASELPIFIPIFFVILLIVIVYTVSYNRQVRARERMEFYLQQLEMAYQKVEELTLLNERQRMARDLHDTLAQGLAGLIMQLEAVSIHINKGNVTRSNEIIHNSMQQARGTLKDARTVIDNLRTGSLGNTDFNGAVLEEIKKFEEITGIHVEKEISPVYSLSNLSMEYGIYIIRESLNNIMKHSQADQVCITIKPKDDQLYMEVTDNGIGFSTKNVGKQTGKYGLIGLQERVKLVGGKIAIESIPGEGTKLTITVPIDQGV
ncbi:sensor histidine kinase [Ureibacillus aquaedulcis]|uniref:histidine kinase n=1 Tax=Ureibacillus aquaedulcis TaxID=3058421 RepID=A0ABT8GSR9_9BACL|nr:sensor histidine kinase [Ureibacillus sp. BA0131]MDN4494465.1 sensor histidine kinase [Ureibacillus sp. BA0131]